MMIRRCLKKICEENFADRQTLIFAVCRQHPATLVEQLLLRYSVLRKIVAWSLEKLLLGYSVLSEVVDFSTPITFKEYQAIPRSPTEVLRKVATRVFGP